MSLMGRLGSAVQGKTGRSTPPACQQSHQRRLSKCGRPTYQFTGLRSGPTI